MSLDIQSNQKLHSEQSHIANHLRTIHLRMQTVAISCERDPNSLQLIAVSKTKSVQAIEEAFLAGQYAFGENYVQESIDKIQYFKVERPNLAEQIEWHFIGPLQSNKSRVVAENFDWLHTLTSVKLAKRLNEQRPSELPPLNVLIQVNVSQEESKSGLKVDDVVPFVESIMQYDRLILRGLMAIPAPITLNSHQTEKEAYLQSIQQLSDLRVDLGILLRERFKSRQNHSNSLPANPIQPLVTHSHFLSHLFFDTLSVGMSEDLELAIESGSTMLRIGSAIFGARE